MARPAGHQHNTFAQLWGSRESLSVYPPLEGLWRRACPSTRLWRGLWRRVCPLWRACLFSRLRRAGRQVGTHHIALPAREARRACPSTRLWRAAQCHISLTNRRPLCYHDPMRASSRPPAAAARAVNQPEPPLSDSQEKKSPQTTVNQTPSSGARPIGRPPAGSAIMAASAQTRHHAISAMTLSPSSMRAERKSFSSTVRTTWPLRKMTPRSLPPAIPTSA